METLLIWGFVLIGHTKSQFVRWSYQGSYQENSRWRNRSCGSKGRKGICDIVNGVSLDWYPSICIFYWYLVILDWLSYFSCSYAGAIFADACLKGLNGVPDVVECSYVQSNVTELPFFASKVINLNSFFILIFMGLCLFLCTFIISSF